MLHLHNLLRPVHPLQNSCACRSSEREQLAKVEVGEEVEAKVEVEEEVEANVEVEEEVERQQRM